MTTNDTKIARDVRPMIAYTLRSDGPRTGYVVRGAKVRAHDRRRAADLGTKVVTARGAGLVAQTTIPMYPDHCLALLSMVGA